MSEPTTTLTDALLALVLAAVAVQVSVTAAATGSAAQATWAAAFAAGSIGAALGAVSHGAKGRLAAPALRPVWLASLVCVLLSQALLLAAIVASAWPAWLPLALGFVAYRVIRLTLALRRQSHFALVRQEGQIMALAAAALGVLALLTVPGSWLLWLFVGLALAAAGLGLQARPGLRLGPLNHNDLYHLAQVPAVLALGQAALAAG
jgi:hypothetical protein